MGQIYVGYESRKRQFGKRHKYLSSKTRKDNVIQKRIFPRPLRLTEVL